MFKCTLHTGLKIALHMIPSTITRYLTFFYKLYSYYIRIAYTNEYIIILFLKNHKENQLIANL